MAFKLNVVRHIEKKIEAPQSKKIEKIIKPKKAVKKTVKKSAKNIIKTEHDLVEAIVSGEAAIMKEKIISSDPKK